MFGLHATAKLLSLIMPNVFANASVDMLADQELQVRLNGCKSSCRHEHTPKNSRAASQQAKTASMDIPVKGVIREFGCGSHALGS